MPDTTSPESPLNKALRWWSLQDDYGGFQTVARRFFDLAWTCNKSCCAPHRHDKRRSFSVFLGKDSKWRFKDFATGETGTLIDFIMLSGTSQWQAVHWLLRESGTQTRTNLEAKKSKSDHFSCKPYRLTKQELDWQKERATELWYNKIACRKIAASRGWKTETIEVLAGQCWLGIYGCRLFYLYSSGYKERLRPLSPERAKTFNGAVPFRSSAHCMDTMWRDDIARSAQVVNICEGETDCITGFDLELSGAWIALPNASTFRASWQDQLAGKHIVLWPDGDEAGTRCKERLLQELSPVALSVEVKQKYWEN